ncbi:plasma membrane fusion protein prm1 [Elasticomyces elasticus]|nr:plasma membrane fusion protein prm1 [Elasticomyces elasticus]KAK4974128.1 plasma membrane fusion protein prm1 [Elasticomyces elasticus]
MASSENQQHNPNPAPPSLSAGDYEMRDYYATQAASQPPPQEEPYLVSLEHLSKVDSALTTYHTPYLGFRARLSQTWLNRWTVLLLLVLIRTLFALASLDDNLGSARREALSMCTSVENVGSAMASMPHYMSGGVNELSAAGIEKAINGLMQMLILSITGVEEIVVFIINLLTQTYVCLITLAVGGSLHVAISVAEDLGNLINSTVKDVGDELGDVAGDFQNAMNGFLTDLSKFESLFTGKEPTPPTIDLSSEITKLQNLELPAGYDQGLDKLNASIPTFAEVNNFTNYAIKLPFEEVKKLMNASLPKYSMNRSLFPVPAKEQLTFCSDNDGVNDFFDDLVAIGRMAKKIFLIVLILAAVLAIIPMAYREIRRWRFMQERAELIKSDSHDSMDAVYLVSRPYTSTAGLLLAKPFKSLRRKTLVRWSVAYATTVPALFVLSLALAGLLGCLCQYILLKAIEKEVPALENQIVGFSDKVVTSLNNASEQWAIGTNAIINDTNTAINEDVFGWVNTTTHAVNNTLNVFVDGMVEALNVTFGGTILYDPILEVLNCLVLLKIQGIENGLTWISDNAHVDFPMLRNDTFSLGAAQKVTGSPVSALETGPDGGAADAITGAVYHVTNAIAKAIRQEAIVSTCILLIWVLVACIGVGRACFLMFKGGEGEVYDPKTAAFASRPRTASQPIDNQLGAGDSHELAPMPRVPTYEQATAKPGDYSANKYNGQSYTLKPNPLPTFEVHSATSPIMHSGLSPNPEKLGSVNGQYVDSAIRRPTHVRASSHGDYGLTSPTSPRPPIPLHDQQSTNEKVFNPFADPHR